eukprot:3428189-Pyramimonas_sp.AAC.1
MIVLHHRLLNPLPRSTLLLLLLLCLLPPLFVGRLHPPTHPHDQLTTPNAPSITFTTAPTRGIDIYFAQPPCLPSLQCPPASPEESASAALAHQA